MIEKILERLEKLKEKHGCDTITCAECERRYGYDCARNESKITIDLCKEIVQEVAKEHGRKLNRCDTCTHFVNDDTVPPICYFCCKGLEDNYVARDNIDHDK